MYWSLENVPWTNLHDLNLDWIVNTMKQTVEQWIAYRLEMDGKYTDFTEQINTDFDEFTTGINEWKTLIETEFSDLQTYVQNYFDNLDLNDSTRYVINQMIASGEFLELLNPSIVSTVQAWLEENITPTTPVVDASLSIAGAAADAAATGKLQDKNLKNLFWVTDTANRTVNGISLTFNEDGSITVDGRSTGTVFIYLRGVSSNTENLPTGTYTVTRWTISGSGNLRLTNNETNVITSLSTDPVTVPLTLTSAGRLYLSIGNNVEIHGTFRFQIEQGTTATSYEPGFETSAWDRLSRYLNRETLATIAEYNNTIDEITNKNGKNLFYVTDTTNRSVNGVDIVFNNDGSITFSGHTTATTYIYLMGATQNVANLPVGTYTITRWTLDGSGNVRVTNNGTNIISSATTDAVKYTLTGTTAPQLYLSIGNNVDVDGTFRFQIESGTVGTDYEPHYNITAVDKLARNDIENIKTEIAYDLRVKYDTYETPTQGASEYVAVLIGNIRYEIIHSIVADTFCDCWRILRACSTTSGFAFQHQLTASGEWECAIRLANRDDFSGGYLHGDEQYINIHWFVDGKEIQNIAALGVRGCDELVCIETSNLLDPEDHSTVIARHGKEYIFNKDGLTINQTIEWRVNATLANCFLAMYPAIKAYSDAIYADNAWTKHTLGETDYSYELADVEKSVIYGSGCYVDFNIEKYPENLEGGNTFLYTDNGGNNYNKCYYRVCSDGIVTSGTRWKSTTKYKISFKE